MTDWDNLEKKWQYEYKKLESEIDIHRISFLLTKKCKCKKEDCIHYQKELKEIFKSKINNLLVSGIKLNASSLNQMINLY